MLGSILTTASDGSLALSGVLISTATSLILGIIVALVFMYRNVYTKNFVVTVALMPALIQWVIMIVNGNLGAGVAVMGAFSLVRFRSVPGNAREISSIFFSMAVGLATGMGYMVYAVLFTLVISGMMLLFSGTGFGEKDSAVKSLRVVIPEDMDYTGVFDDLFAEYTRSASLTRVRTTNLGSLFEIQYTIVMKDNVREKEMLDKIRQRNGNLSITCGRIAASKDEL